MTVSEIARLLGEQADTVARHLLPNGKRDGQEWRVGSTGGEAGASLGVHLTGTKAGVWADFATGEAGDLIDLWARVRCNGHVGKAVTEAKQWLGIRDPEFHGHASRSYKPPVVPKCTKPRGPVHHYLTGKRYLTEDTLAAYQIGTAGAAIVFPFLVDGELVMVKVREASDGAKPKPTSAEQRPCLFGWQAIPDNARTVTICEGEIDAMTLYQYGYPALSVPFGGGKGAKQQWLEHEYHRLERFDRIYLCFDNDKAGQEALEEIAPRLGRHRCYRVVLPRKDANECLTAGIPSLAEYFEAARTFDPVQLRSAAEFVDDVIAEFWPGEEQARRHIALPWEPAHGELVLREAELSVFFGINGHGKSQIVNHIAVDAMAQGHRVCIASMEIQPRKMLKQITRQAAAVTGAIPSIPYIRAVMDWMGDKLWIFECVGTAKANELLEVMEYACKRYGVTLFVIDSLMKCGFAEDDYNATKLFVERLCDFKNANNCHVVLVAHSRKVENETSRVGKMDLKGTSAVADLCDTLVAVVRNKRKEEARKGGSTDYDDQPDTFLYCDKQRNGDGKEPRIGLWLNPATMQFVSFDGQRPKQYVEWSGEVEIVR